MSSIAHEVIAEASKEHPDIGIKEFSRMERMLLFAVISECERCICSEGYDCFDATTKTVSCPFVPIREEYSVRDIIEWKEIVR